MWNKTTANRLTQLPNLYQTENIELKDKIVHLHFFIGGCDWYAVEFDGEDLFFGYTILNQDYHCAEWGYFSLSEMASIRAAPGRSPDGSLRRGREEREEAEAVRPGASGFPGGPRGARAEAEEGEVGPN